MISKISEAAALLGFLYITLYVEKVTRKQANLHVDYRFINTKTTKGEGKATLCK